MKKILLLVCMLFPLISMGQQQSSTKPFVIPELREWQGVDGSLTVGSNSAIVVSKEQSDRLLPIANQFASDIQQMFNIKVSVRVGRVKAGDISLAIDSDAVNIQNKEAYKIKIGKTVDVAANEPLGVLWATRTLLQMGEKSLTLPCGVIRDFPAYPMRGFMLDVARKYFPLEYLESLVKIMSYYKMNTFQVHLNDNGFKEYFDNDWNKTYAAFRLESETYPGLAAKDGHYTKKAFRQFQLDALNLGVTIVPEIDAPAHTLAFSHYMPEVGSEHYGMDHFDLFNPKTYEFMDGLFKEYLSGDEPVFVNEIVHIGTDEYSNKDKEVVEKFRYFTDYYIKYVESFGKKAALWGALTHAKGDTPVKVDNVLMWCWYNGYGDPRAMIEAGYDVISIPDGLTYIVPAAGYYYDYLNTKYLYEKWTPAVIGGEVFEEGHPKIKGGMFAVWNDHCGNGISVQDVHHRIMPALQTVALKAWDGVNTTLPYWEFDIKRESLSEAPGVNLLARPHANRRGVILDVAKPKPGSISSISDIGYDYRVEFDLTAGLNEKGMVMFESPSSKFYITDPSEGKLGYTRDGYNYRFNYAAPVGKLVKVAVEGTNKSTKLFIDGKLVESLDIVPFKEYTEADKKRMNWVQTLVFPLAQVGTFNGKIENLKVTAL